jgi:NAD(P)-dependent dehydrogenase (short-subunit alcohol dehydrogenase family)
MAVTFDFSQKTVFVAGGTSGINLGIAMAFARHGASVAVLSRKQDKVDNAVEQLRALGTAAVGFSADVRNYDAVALALQQTRDQLGEIDVLVSGAAGNFPATAERLSPNGFKSVVDIDLLGTFHVLRAAYPHLRKPGAAVINISAPQSQQPMAQQLHVCAAKAGVDMVTRVLAIEWGRVGIRVNTISPGPIAETEGLARLAPSPQAVDAAIESIPLGRLGTANDIADAAIFLASPSASFVTGAYLPVDGGWLLAGAAALSASFQQGT